MKLYRKTRKKQFNKKLKKTHSCRKIYKPKTRNKKQRVKKTKRKYKGGTKKQLVECKKINNIQVCKILSNINERTDNNSKILNCEKNDENKWVCTIESNTVNFQNSFDEPGPTKKKKSLKSAVSSAATSIKDKVSSAATPIKKYSKKLAKGVGELAKGVADSIIRSNTSPYGVNHLISNGLTGLAVEGVGALFN